MPIKTVFVGLSGGVDSSVAASLLRQDGHRVVGVYMKNWTRQLPGQACGWRDDYLSAKRTAVHLDIDFKVYDFEVPYRRWVVEPMVRGYQAGRTPNPDVACNHHIKFNWLLKTALADKADLLATGHYARLGHKANALYQARCAAKDQTYFMYRMDVRALKRLLLPLGDFSEKAAVRAAAATWGLPAAARPDSQGICFVGPVGIKQFLLSELGPQPGGDIIDQAGRHVGRHDGAIFYTLGQRRGLNVGGGLPYYVTGKDMVTNKVFVTTDLNSSRLWSSRLRLQQLHWLALPPARLKGFRVRIRHLGPMVKISDSRLEGRRLSLDLEERVRAATPGQSAVIYDDGRVVGGGIIV